MSESSREACFGGVKVSKLCMDCVCGCVLASLWHGMHVSGGG